MATACALFFDAVDENGNVTENDRLFHEHESSRGVVHVLEHVCRIEDEAVSELIALYHRAINEGNRELGSSAFQD